MKKFIINTLLLSSALSIQSFVYPVSCSGSKGSFIDQNAPEETKILKSEFKYDFFKEGPISEQKVCDKIKKIANEPKNKKYFEHDFLPYSTPKWNNNDYYVQIDLSGKYYPEIKLHALYKDDFSMPSFYLGKENISYLADEKSVNKIYDQLVDFHSQITSLKYYLDLELNNSDITLKQISSYLYDDFFKRLFPDIISDNTESSTFPTYKIFEKYFYCDQQLLKTYFGYDTISEQSNYSATPFMIQAIDTKSNLSLDLGFYNNQLKNNNYNTISEKNYKRLTDEFISKKLSSLIDFNNVKFNFNWSFYDDNDPFPNDKDYYIFNPKITNFIKNDLIKKDKLVHTDFNEKNELKKSENVDIKNIPAYKNGSISLNTSLKQSDLELNSFSNIEKKENDFFKELFLDNINDMFFYKESFNIFNSLLNSLSVDRYLQDWDINLLILFVNKTITLTIDNVSVKFKDNLIDQKNNIEIIDKSTWTNFYNKLNSNTNKVLNIKLNDGEEPPLLKGDSEFKVNIN